MPIPTDRAERRAYFTQRLRDNLAAAETEHARILASVTARRERGEDTARVVPPSVVSSDFTLAKAEGRVEHARRALAEYAGEPVAAPRPVYPPYVPGVPGEWE